MPEPTARLRAVQPESPQPPSHLRVTGRRLWRAVFELHDLDAVELETLRVACEALDGAATARRQLDREGRTFADRFGQPRVHPAVEVEAKARAAYLAALRALDLSPEEAPARDGRYSPVVGGRRRSRA